jgi:hypothetical protein
LVIFIRVVFLQIQRKCELLRDMVDLDCERRHETWVDSV